MKIHKDLDNILGRSVAQICDSHLCAVRDLVIDNFPNVVGIHIDITQLEDGSYRHKVDLTTAKEEDETTR